MRLEMYYHLAAGSGGLHMLKWELAWRVVRSLAAIDMGCALVCSKQEAGAEQRACRQSNQQIRLRPKLALPTTHAYQNLDEYHGE